MDATGRRRMRDSSIICLLIFTWLFTAIAVIGADTKMTNFEKRLEEVYGHHDDQLSDHREQTEQRMTELEARVTDLEHENSIIEARLDIHRAELTNLNGVFTNILEDMDALEKKFDALPRNALNLKLTETDIRNIAALVYLEAGSGSYELQKAIASVIFNRMLRYGMTASQTIWQRGVFSPASRVSRTVPSESCVRAVRDIMTNGLSLPSDVLAFQLGGYHGFGRPYGKIQNVYFNTM